MIFIKIFFMMLVIFLIGYGLAWFIFFNELTNYNSEETKDNISYDDYVDLVVNDCKETFIGKPKLIVLMISPFALLKSNKKISSELFPQEYD